MLDVVVSRECVFLINCRTSKLLNSVLVQTRNKTHDHYKTVV